MATGTASPPKPPAKASAYEDYISEQVRKTQGYVRLVDIATALMTIGAAALIYLLVVAVLDHWVIRGGLGTWGRGLALILLLAGICAYAAKTLVPYFRKRVNPVFAAETIERAEPNLKNSLVNFLLLRRNHPGVPEIVFRGLEQQTAAQLTDVSIESTVDRKHMLRVAFVLVAALLCAALYKVFSPKDMLPSVGRVLAPWADIAPVTRVQIKNIRPGNTEAVLLSQLEVSAVIRGLREDESAQLVYSSADEQAVDLVIPMFRREGEADHSCRLPDNDSGLSHDLMYRIEAGDCISRTFNVTVVTAPTIRVKSVDYDYPDYTGLGKRNVEGVGDIKALEGTEVIVHAEASQEIAEASLRLDGLRKQSRPMRFEGKAAFGRLQLMRRITGTESLAEFTAYQLHYVTPRGDANQNPVRHRIEIIADKAPLVEILKPTQPEVELPADDELYIQVRGRDPDFRLSALRIMARKQDDETIIDEDLLQIDSAGVDGARRATFRFLPSRYGLKAGDVVRYVAIAKDNKTPEPNQSETAEYRVRITQPLRQPQQQEDQEQQAKDKQGGDPEAGQGGAQEDGQSGQEAGGGQGQEDESGSESGGGQSGASSESSGGQDEPSESGAKGQGSETDQSPSDGADQSSGSDTGGGQPSPTKSDPEAGQGQEEPGQPDGASPQSGAEQDGASEESQEPIDNDGEAFQKALEHMKRSRQESEEKPGEAGTDAAEKGGGQTQGKGQQEDQSSQGTPGEATDSGSDEGGEDGGGQQADQRTTDGEDDPRQRPDQQAGDAKTEKDEGEGSDSESAAGSRKSQQEGGGGKGNQGQDAPAPPEGRNDPKEKSGKPKQGGQQDQGEPEASSISEKESDSAEGEQGTRSGQGEEGGGQQSRQAGEGAEGSHTPSDSGGNPSQESGQGDTSNRAGDDTASDTKTGRPSDQPGQASQSKDGSEGAASGQQPMDPPDGSRDSQQPSDSSDSPPSDGNPNKGQRGSETSGEGRLGDSVGEASPDSPDQPAAQSQDDPETQEPGGDEANLDYVRKQTELVLDYLQDQLDEGNIDPDLKKKFGWTDEEFAEFVRRHGNLRDRAARPGDDGRTARDELDDSLRSLGLRPPSARIRTGITETEKARGLGEQSRTKPPQEYQEQFEAFRKDAFRN